MTHDQLQELAQWLTHVVVSNLAINVANIPACPKGLCFNLVVHDPTSHHSTITSDGSNFANWFGQEIASSLVARKARRSAEDEPS